MSASTFGRSEGAQRGMMPVVPCAQATTSRPSLDPGRSGTTTTPETAIGSFASPRDR